MVKLQNNFTTPEQSKRLLELGVTTDSADLQIPYIEYYDLSPSDNEKIVQCYEYLAPIFWDETEHGLLPKDKVLWEREFAGEKYDGHTTEYIPCWSVGRLMEICKICEPKKDYEQLCEELQYSKNYCVVIISHIIANLQIIDFSKLED